MGTLTYAATTPAARADTLVGQLRSGKDIGRDDFGGMVEAIPGHGKVVKWIGTGEDVIFRDHSYVIRISGATHNAVMVILESWIDLIDTYGSVTIVDNNYTPGAFTNLWLETLRPSQLTPLDINLFLNFEKISGSV